GLIEKCYVYDARRAIDFANSWNCIVRDCYAMQSRFTTHGLLSRHITFEKCYVFGRGESVETFEGFTFGNESFMFDQDISVINCYSYNSYYGLSTVAGTNNVTVSNCHFYNSVLGIAFRDGTDI